LNDSDCTYALFGFRVGSSLLIPVLGPVLPLYDRPNILIHLDVAPEAAWLDEVRWSPGIERYVDCAAVPKLRGQTNAQSVNVTIRAMCLNFRL
jgi:hypothetical protein